MGVAFLNPILFGLMGLVAVPLLVHLIQRRHGREILFPTIRFLRVAQDQYQKRVKLENRNLLYLRAGLFILLAFALAQPVIRMAGTQLATSGSRTSAVILIDTSYSMMANDNGVARMDRAKELARGALKVFRENDQVALISLSNRGNEVLAPLAPLSGLLEDRMDKLQAVPFSSDLAAGLAQAQSLLSDATNDLREIYLISDMQKIAAKNIQAASPSTSPMNLHLLSVGVPDAENTAVTDLISEPAVVSKGGRAVLRGMILNYGTNVRRNSLVQLVSGPGQASRLHVDLPSNEAKAVSFSKAYPVSGLQPEQIVLEPDALPLDDTRQRVVPVSTQSLALVIDGRGDALNGRGASFFVVSALEACGLASQKRGATGFEIRKMTVPGELPAMEFMLYQLVVLCDVKSISPAAARTLTGYVQNGGSLLVFLGPNADAGSLNRTIVPAIFPYSFIGPKSLVQEQAPQSFFWKTVDYQNPIFEMFSDLQKGDVGLAKFTNYQVVKVEDESNPPAVGGEFARGTVLAKFDSKDPAVILSDAGRGRGVFFLSSADTTWNDFPLHSVFVAVIGEVVSYLTAGGQNKVSFQVGESVPLSIRSRQSLTQPVVLNVQSPDNLEYTVAAAPSGLTAKGFFLQTDKPGFYKVSLSADAKDLEVYPSVFAVNLDSVESDLKGLTPDESKTLLSGQFKVDYVKPSAFTTQRLTRAREGLGLWNYLLLFLWLVVLFETYYANRMAQN